MMQLNARTDIEDVPPEIRVPTLILHRARDQWVLFDNARHLRDAVPGAELVELPGVDHHPWIGDVEPVHRAIGAFMRAL